MISLLYVDDEPELLNLGKLFLEREGEFSVTTTASSPEGLELMAGGTFDAIISDYQMPVMDGIEFLKQVRDRGLSTPFILFTGKGREEVVIEAINNGADFYLQKGGDARPQFAELRHKILAALERRRAIDALRDSEQRLSDIINFLPDATFAIDTAGKIIAWNKAIEKMLSDAAFEADPQKRKDMYNKVQDMLVAEAPAIWVLDYFQPTVLRSNVKGYRFNPYYLMTFNVYDMYIE